MKSLALYVHIPFCVQKCYYCDFLSFDGIDRPAQDAYFDALSKEIYEAAAVLPKQSPQNYEISSIYFGGGTPSFPAPSKISKVLDAIHDNFHVRTGAEITLEANPGTVSLEKFQLYREAGINRLSIGAQSMMNLDLQHLGRAHTVSQFYEAYRNARTAGFRNISVDVIMGLPGQQLHDYLNTLREVVECKPEHISSYSLTIEKGTPYYEVYGEGKQPLIDNKLGLMNLPLPDDEEERKMYAETGHFLRTAGYHRYEISNYAKNDDGRPNKYESKHNIVYWTRGDYLGFGLGASSMIENTRFSNTRDFKAYADAGGDVEKIREGMNSLDINSQIEEFMFLGLRMMQGVSVLRFEETFDVSMGQVYGALIDALVKQELITVQDGFVALTTSGIDVSNTVMSYFLFDRDADGKTIAGGGLNPAKERKAREISFGEKNKNTSAEDMQKAQKNEASKNQAEGTEEEAPPPPKKRKWPESNWVHGGDL